MTDKAKQSLHQPLDARSASLARNLIVSLVTGVGVLIASVANAGQYNNYDVTKHDSEFDQAAHETTEYIMDYCMDNFTHIEQRVDCVIYSQQEVIEELYRMLDDADYDMTETLS